MAFGAIGIPIIVAGQVTGIDEMAISAMVGRQLPLLSLLIPFYLVLVMSGWKGVKEVWPAALCAGASFAALASLPAVTGAVSMRPSIVTA